ncbi:LysR family transcriptional regulator [Pseudomonas aeruginosa]|nr:LysR family transcriptional regulator [Pseudomonas aeruginosa]TEI34480.1 LysR family transcriptional regulator [Pseudomonas aeruginosa]SQC60583.1 transcriptional regulator [Pseudomonas aeruginosa]HBP6801995.1 LysR family transcriptional regulator [Pseudomonas aeruginosa]
MPAFTRSELADLNVFMTIVRRRSFRHSAQELGVSTSALSHSMRNLEARLGVKLLNRTSRSVVPTDAGSALAAKLEDGFQVIGEALGELDAYRTSPVGRLRLNVPRDASRLLLGPVLRRFTEAYPDLQLELSVEDRMVDIVADGYDAGIRYGGTVPQDMVAVPLTGELRWVWKQNRSEGDSFYFLDPDGHRLEAHVGDLRSRLAACRQAPYAGMRFAD